MIRIQQSLKIIQVIIQFRENKNIINITSVKNWIKSLRIPQFLNSNIPLDETIDICINHLFENTDTVELKPTAKITKQNVNTPYGNT